MADLTNNEVLDPETLEYLESLNQQELQRLWNSPFARTIIKAAVHSATVLQKVEAVLDAEYAAMPSEERERVDRIAANLKARFAK